MSPERMAEFEYLLRYVLGSHTLKLMNKKKCAGSQQKQDFYARYKRNDTFCAFFLKKDKNTFVPLFNLPIDFEKTEHTLYYGVIAIGKTIYADKAYSVEFSPPEGFDSFVVYDETLKIISDYEEQPISTENSCEKEDSKIELNELSSDGADENLQIDKFKAQKEFAELLKEYRDIGYDFNDNRENKNLKKMHGQPQESARTNGKTVNNNENVRQCLERLALKGQNEGACKNREDLLVRIVDGNIDIKRFSYVIKDSERILPLYEVEFHFDKNLELQSKKSNMCERCQKREANMFCVAERASFCKECDQKLHYDFFTRRHLRHYFSKLGGSKKFFNCEEHPETVVDYFCKECKIPLCTQCRLKGSHPSDHALITYLQANELVDKLKAEINFTEEEKKNTTCMSLLKVEIDRFRSNVAEVKALLNKQYRAILNELDVFTNKKYQIFNAKYLEVFKENQSLLFTKNFVVSLDNSKIIQNYRTILEQRDALKVKEDPKVKYKSIYLNGTLSLQAVEHSGVPRKKNMSAINKSKEFYAESSESRIDRY
ncbi:putative E3 ubiquitin ligase [Trachipleistophora hominis]|uniref:Putative E3 ubiquitin ligase n=1 Tax=Trachipleistophora hominis TaxID=72359 RepID=L7JV69_TRAHO|nr:putative E3 ubiquitin ligase [Trachipleistophora hominis]